MKGDVHQDRAKNQIRYAKAQKVSQEIFIHSDHLGPSSNTSDKIQQRFKRQRETTLRIHSQAFSRVRPQGCPRFRNYRPRRHSQRKVHG